MSARSIFFEHMRSFDDAIRHESIVAREPKEIRENARARTMRNGLAVIGFSILEDFLRNRAKELLTEIGDSGVQFQRLPDSLKRVLTAGALAAAASQLRLRRPGGDDILFAQEMAQQIASTFASPFSACKVSFGYEGSNLTNSAVEEFLKSLNIEKPWESIGQLAFRAGIGTLTVGARAAFDDIARRRHEAAHDPQANVQPSDLQGGALNALGIAFAFDAIASVAALNFKLMNISTTVLQRNIGMVFVNQREDGRFGVIREKTTRYYRCFDYLEQARAVSRTLCLRSKEMCVVRNAKRIPIDWELVAL